MTHDCWGMTLRMNPYSWLSLVTEYTWLSDASSAWAPRPRHLKPLSPPRPPPPAPPARSPFSLSEQWPGGAITHVPVHHPHPSMPPVRICAGCTLPITDAVFREGAMGSFHIGCSPVEDPPLPPCRVRAFSGGFWLLSRGCRVRGAHGSGAQTVLICLFFMLPKELR